METMNLALEESCGLRGKGGGKAHSRNSEGTAYMSNV